MYHMHKLSYHQAHLLPALISEVFLLPHERKIQITNLSAVWETGWQESGTCWMVKNTSEIAPIRQNIVIRDTLYCNDVDPIFFTILGTETWVGLAMFWAGIEAPPASIHFPKEKNLTRLCH